jgi:hypothetical protein
MSNGSVNRPQCWHFHFGLIVTGRTEAEHLPKLFRLLATTRICTFEVIRFVGQRNPVTSQKRLAVTGTTKPIPPKDVEEIGLPARSYLARSDCHFVILVDDLEHSRQSLVQQVYERYRTGLHAP